jgi:Flp pilus assembly protein TadD
VLERVTDLNSGNWNAWWGLGIARRLLGDHENAYAAFARAYGLNPNNVEVGRNLAAECVALGYGREAVEISAAVMRLAPDQPGLIANYALALLINGDPHSARDEAARALALDPGDEVTRNLCGFIDDVLAGRTSAPKKVATS